MILTTYRTLRFISVIVFDVFEFHAFLTLHGGFNWVKFISFNFYFIYVQFVFACLGIFSRIQNNDNWWMSFIINIVSNNPSTKLTKQLTSIVWHTTTRQPQRMIRILDLKLDKLFSSFWISHLPVKTHWNWVCNSSLTAFAKAREQRDRRDRPSSREKHNKKSKQRNTIDSHRFFVF